MYQKFVIDSDGVLRFGTVFLHRDLLGGDDFAFGGGLWQIDPADGSLILFGRSFDFGRPDFSRVERIDWSGVGGTSMPMTFYPHWPSREGAIHLQM